MTVPMIRRLVLKRFRSVETATIELDNPTVLVGRNGSGKSNIIDAIAFLSEAMTSSLSTVFDKRGGVSSVRHRRMGRGKPGNFGMRVDLADLDDQIEMARYAFEIRAASRATFEVAREECIIRRRCGTEDYFKRRLGKNFTSSLDYLKPKIESSALALPLLGGTEQFMPISTFLSSMRVYRPDPVVLAELQDPFDDDRLRSNCINIATALDAISRTSTERHRALTELLGAAVPNTIAVRSKRLAKKLGLEFTQQLNGKPPVRFDSHEISDGTLRILGLLVAVFQQFHSSVLAFEEPESTVHPGALAVIVDALREATATSQILVTTHSPELLDEDWVNDKNLKIVRAYNGKTVIEPIADGAKSMLQDHLATAGELLRMNALEKDREIDLFDGEVANQLPLFEMRAR